MYISYRHGKSRSGTEYGPLTDLPDWSYAGIYIRTCPYTQVCSDIHCVIIETHFLNMDSTIVTYNSQEL